MSASHSTSDASASDLRLAARRDWAGWIAVGLVGGLVVLLSWFRIGNLDLGYHVAYGRHLLSTGEIVGFQPDPFLYAPTRAPFVNANWGSQLILALVEQWGGATGLFALRLSLIATIFASMGHVVFRQTFRPWAVAMVWLMAALAGYERFSLRPELFSYAILSVQLVLLVGGLSHWWRVAALVALQLLLVNLHSYFLLGVALTFCWAVEAAGAGLLRRWAASLYDKMGSAHAKLVLIALGLQVVACFCHPWHWRAALFPLRTVGYLAETGAMGAAGAGTGSWSNISEFQSPFSFWGMPINRFTIDAFVLLLIVVAIGVVAALRRGAWAHVFAMTGFFIVATQMRRNIAPFAFIATPLAVVALTRLFGPSSGSDVRRRRLRLGTSIGLIAASLTMLVFVGSGRWYFWERRITRQRGTGYSDVTFPQSAVAWLNNQDALQSRLFVDYFSSSNALLWLKEGERLFVDTNTFAYADTTLDEAFRLGLGELPYKPFFDREGVNVVMLHAGPDTQILIGQMVRDDFNWALVYVDQSVVIFLRRQVWDHVDVISANRITPAQLDVDAWIASATGAGSERALRLGTMANVPLSLRWWKQGEALCRAAVELAPDYHEAWLQMGTCAGNLGNEAEAAGDIASAVKHWERAVECFEKVLTLDEDNASAKTFRSRTRKMLRRYGASQRP